MVTGKWRLSNSTMGEENRHRKRTLGGTKVSQERLKFRNNLLNNESEDSDTGRESGPVSGPKLLPLSRRKQRTAESLDSALTSAILTQDRELACILREVDELSKTLKSTDGDNEAISKTLQRTVLCALKQSLLEKELRSLALTDDLTCLYNRRAFLALATQQLKVARRKDQGLLLFFVDVDNLKAINDSYGHREGDFALVRTADALEQTFRDSDIIARLGGDEFAILALEASSLNQDVILRRLAESLRDSTGVESRYQLTLSVGVARFDRKDSISLGELIARADHAMYEEKRSHHRLAASRS
jgi:diguanylate cyclase (GGDEF)-like protein